MIYLLTNVVQPDQQTVVFTATRHHCEYLDQLLKMKNFETSVIYGTLDQTARKINIAKFRNKQTKVLIVTDVAARGIDIPLLEVKKNPKLVLNVHESIYTHKKKK